MTAKGAPENRNSETPKVTGQSINGKPECNDRRKVLKKLAVGTAAVAGCSVLPSKWTSPLVEFGTLPAHAVTSGTTTATTTETATPADTSREVGSYHGRFNGNRPTWYFSRKMKNYPSQFTVVIEGCGTVEVTSNNGVRFESNGIVIKQSHVSGRGMGVIGQGACGSAYSYIKY